jgi:hypothetical protein
MTLNRALSVLVILVLLGIGADAVHGADTVQHYFLPNRSTLFHKPLADPRSLDDHISFVEIDARQETQQPESRRPFIGGLIGIATDYPLYRGESTSTPAAWQLDLEGGILSQFNVEASSDDLLNTDFLVGFPLTYRNGPYSARFRVMHQSSHLGDELLLRDPAPERINLSLEFADFTLAYRLDRWRFFAGAGDAFRQQPETLDVRNLHGGIEYVSPEGPSGASFLGGYHYRRSAMTNWSSSSGFKAGVRFRGNQPRSSVLDVLLEYYNGPFPYGQFFTIDTQYAGIGVYLRQ